MNNITHLFLIAALLLPPAVKAQTFNLRFVVQPDTIIGGQIIEDCLGPSPAVLNDLGDIAFQANCDGRDRIFTTRRIVVSAGDRIDGKIIRSLFQVIAINNQGQVLYNAIISDAIDSPMESSRDGLFLDHHLLSAVTYDAAAWPYTYRLTDDGRIYAEIASPDAAYSRSMPLDAAPARACPGNIRAAPKRNRKATSLPSAATNLPQFDTSLAPVARNRCGQLLLTVNAYSGGLFLLLATPVKR